MLRYVVETLNLTSYVALIYKLPLTRLINQSVPAKYTDMTPQGTD